YSSGDPQLIMRIDAVRDLVFTSCTRVVQDYLEQDRRQFHQSVLSYDGIGHALRTFVEATGYQGAVKQLREVEDTEGARLSELSQRRIRCARQALQMFEHAEMLGSLMRLHGWLCAEDKK